MQNRAVGLTDTHDVSVRREYEWKVSGKRCFLDLYISIFSKRNWLYKILSALYPRIDDIKIDYHTNIRRDYWTLNFKRLLKIHWMHLVNEEQLIPMDDGNLDEFSLLSDPSARGRCGGPELWRLLRLKAGNETLHTWRDGIVLFDNWKAIWRTSFTLHVSGIVIDFTLVYK